MGLHAGPNTMYIQKILSGNVCCPSSIQKVKMMHISQLYVLSINIDGITKNRKYHTDTSQNIKHQTCLQTFTLASMLQLSVTMMSWVQVWVDLRLFTTQFSDKVLLDIWKLKERE